MQEVKIWEEPVVIPTYEIGAADRNPMFLEKRVYQGSCGKVYPYPTTETISPVKTDKTYQAVWLENEYIKVMVLPELGGRIQRAYDKTNGYDFVYYNQVIKPALVGLAGPWISGGIEFNWPQHHRPTTFMPVDHLIRENPDGSKTLFVHDVDQMYGTKGIAGFTLYPDRAYIEIRGQLYNRTASAQTFLWWANPAVSVNDQTQSVFPPDVHNVMDHGKRDVSRFPIATGVYYKHDYSEGVDISRYKNIPVPTSYMAEKSEYDFVGGYDYGKEAGILHVADHHISPGKKQWTWGCGDFGKAWDRNLTDEDGPYIELMTGVFTDNQPDFSWLKPFEEKTFKQYFMPYKQVGYVKNATIDAMVNMEVTEEGVSLCVYATSRRAQAEIILSIKGEEVFKESCVLSPTDIYKKVVAVKPEKETDLKVQVLDGEKLLVEYQPKEQGIPEMAKPAEPAKEPQEILTNEELFLTALHIEQYRHATYLPDPYYLEGLKRDPSDSRINNAYGNLLMRRGDYTSAEKHFRTALKRLTWRNPNPYNSEAYYNLGLVLFLQSRYDEAYDAFFKAAWSSEQQEMAFYYLAAIAARRGRRGTFSAGEVLEPFKTGAYSRPGAEAELEAALELVEKGLVKNWHNVKARGLKAVILRKLGRNEEALAWISENKKVDPFDFLSSFEEYFLTGEEERLTALNGLMRNFHENYLMIARDYAEAGFYEEAIKVLENCTQEKPMLHYYAGYYLSLLGKTAESLEEYRKAETMDPLYTFPNKLEDIAVLEAVIKADPAASKAPYYLGCLFYDKLQFDRAIALWEDSEAKNDTFPTVLRNLSIAYYNKRGDAGKALEKLEKAFALDTTDARVFLELDQLYKKLDRSVEERLGNYEKYAIGTQHPKERGGYTGESDAVSLVKQRDDLMIEYVTLLNSAGRYQECYDTIMGHTFRPWEGAEGKVSAQYKAALVQMAKKKIIEGVAEISPGADTSVVCPENSTEKQTYVTAGELLQKALEYPLNLGEGRLEGTKDNHIWYLLGTVKEVLGEDAEECYRKATEGTDEPAGMMYYYDQPADMILYKGLAYEKLGEHRAACACFHKLIDYGEQHIHDEVKIDYFAVSLPDFLIFEDDLTKRNEAHCYYLMGLGNLGLGQKVHAAEYFEEVLRRDPSHQNGIFYRQMAV
ncbi:MAG: DUF5107 domain-containing protein [Blautia sp.]|nr:DUF5107 domain-containing protein [Blautia sp.]